LALTVCPCSTGTSATVPVIWLPTSTRYGVATRPLATTDCTTSVRTTFAASTAAECGGEEVARDRERGEAGENRHRLVQIVARSARMQAVPPQPRACHADAGRVRRVS
jgi:hypothetical protein